MGSALTGVLEEPTPPGSPPRPPAQRARLAVPRLQLGGEFGAAAPRSRLAKPRVQSAWSEGEATGAAEGDNRCLNDLCRLLWPLLAAQLEQAAVDLPLPVFSHSVLGGRLAVLHASGLSTAGPPEFRVLRVEQASDSVLMLDVRVCFDAPVDIALAPASRDGEDRTIQVDRVALKGVLTVVVRLFSESPWVGALQLFFNSMPEVDITLREEPSGHGPRTDAMVGALAEALQRRFVVPHAKCMAVAPELGPMECDAAMLSCVPPLGVARLRLEAVRLKAHGVLPEAVIIEVRLGGSVWRSPAAVVHADGCVSWGRRSSAAIGHLLFSGLEQQLSLAILTAELPAKPEVVAENAVQSAEGHLLFSALKVSGGGGAYLDAHPSKDPAPSQTQILGWRNLGVHEFLTGASMDEQGFLELHAGKAPRAPPATARGPATTRASRSSGAAVAEEDVGPLLAVLPEWLELELPLRTPRSWCKAAVCGALGVRVGSIIGLGAPFASIVVTAGLDSEETRLGELQPSVLEGGILGGEFPLGVSEYDDVRPDVDQRAAAKLRDKGWSVEEIAEMFDLEAGVVADMLADAAAPRLTFDDMVWVLVAGSTGPGSVSSIEMDEAPRPGLIHLEVRGESGEVLGDANLDLPEALVRSPDYFFLSATPQGVQFGLAASLQLELGFEFWPCRPRAALTARPAS